MIGSDLPVQVAAGVNAGDALLHISLSQTGASEKTEIMID